MHSSYKHGGHKHLLSQAHIGCRVCGGEEGIVVDKEERTSKVKPDGGRGALHQAGTHIEALGAGWGGLAGAELSWVSENSSGEGSGLERTVKAEKEGCKMGRTEHLGQEISVYCLSHPVLGILSYQSRWTTVPSRTSAPEAKSSHYLPPSSST